MQQKLGRKRLLKFQGKFKCMIIIGGKNSSNTRKLYDIARENCDNTIIVETKDELDIKNIKQFEIFQKKSKPASHIVL